MGLAKAVEKRVDELSALLLPVFERVLKAQILGFLDLREDARLDLLPD